MKKLRIILQSKIFYLVCLVFIIFYIIIFTKITKYYSLYQDGSSSLKCIIKNINNADDKVSMLLNCEENIQAYYYGDENYDLLIGDKIDVNGILSSPSNNTIENTFNYKKYLYNNKIYKILTIKTITNIKHSKNIFYIIKNKIIKRCNNKYISLFILGDKSGLENETYEIFKNIGIAHLLAISGMHVAVIIKILNKLLFFIKSNKRNMLIILFLIFFAYLANFTPSIIRVILFFVLSLLNKKFLLNLSNIKLLILTSILMLIYNPFYIYNISFLYSFTAVLAICLTVRYQSKNYFVNTFKISLFICLLSMPITINNNYEINFILLISNLILIPFVSYIFFPLALITFICPIFNKLFLFMTFILEKLVYFFDLIKIFKFNMPRFNIVIILIYYIILLMFFYYGNKKYLIYLVILLLINILIPKLDNTFKVIYLDVGQGDSALIITPYHKNIIMIDTGGNINKSIIQNTILYLKSKSINHIDYLITTHGDNDHMGEAINLVKKFKVDNVIFNCGSYNDLENELKEVLQQKNIQYYTCINELKFNKYKLQFLNTVIYDNENDNSNVIYLNYNNNKFLFMGDASISREEDILKKYNLENIDFLKVGHHGSDTSSSEEFISNINPKYSLISVGKNNRYGHPKDSVIKTLEKSNSTIYRTDNDGSIEIKINENGYKIRTCSP